MREVFHSGEKEIQRITGEEPIANANARIIVDAIIPGVINFIEKQPLTIVATSDEAGQLWASLLIGNFGFLKVPNSKHVEIKESLIFSSRQDIFFKNILFEKGIGMLFIELATRKRFRVNGKVSSQEKDIVVSVEEAYANCPKYIQRRTIQVSDQFSSIESTVSQGSLLGELQKQSISSADTLFVASQDGAGKLDASHRGGNIGFVEILDDSTLKIPDYQGNSMYNTLGNLLQNPNIGLLFIDFEQGKTLQLTGQGELLFDQSSQENLQKTTGTGRYWLFKTKSWIIIENHHKVNWQFLDFSPFNP